MSLPVVEFSLVCWGLFFRFGVEDNDEEMIEYPRTDREGSDDRTSE